MNDLEIEVFTKIWNAYREYGHPKSEEEYKTIEDKLLEIGESYSDIIAKDIAAKILKEVKREYKRNPYC